MQQRLEVEPGQPAAEHLELGGAHRARQDVALAPLLDRVELDAALGRGQHRRQIAHARHGLGLARARGAPDRRGRQRLDVPDRVADADPAPMVDVRRAPELGRERGHDLLHERRNAHRDVARGGARLLIHDHDLVAELLGVVRADLRAEPVLQRRHDAAAVRVVVGVRGRDQQQVERQPDPVAADLDVALLQDVEQRHLDALGQVGELVDRHDAAVRARDHAVVDRELVARGSGPRPRGSGRRRRSGRRRDVSGVASFSAYRSSRRDPVGSARRRRPPRPARRTARRSAGTGDRGSRSRRSRGSRRQVSSTIARTSRVFAWPRSPSRIRSWPARIPRSSTGSTASSNPTIPGNSSSPRSSLREQVRAELVLHRAVRVSGVAERADRRGLRHPARVSRLADKAAGTRRCRRPLVGSMWWTLSEILEDLNEEQRRGGPRDPRPRRHPGRRGHRQDHHHHASDRLSGRHRDVPGGADPRRSRSPRRRRASSRAGSRGSASRASTPGRSTRRPCRTCHKLWERTFGHARPGRARSQGAAHLLARERAARPAQVPAAARAGRRDRVGEEPDGPAARATWPSSSARTTSRRSRPS